MSPPLLPPYLTDSDINPLRTKHVQKTLMPNPPMTDNFVKYRVANLQIPEKIDLDKVRILWS